MPSSLDAIPDVHEFMEQLSTSPDIDHLSPSEELDVDDITQSTAFDYIDNEPLGFNFNLHITIKATFRILATLLASGYTYNELLRATDSKNEYRSAYKELKYFLESRCM